MRLVEAGHTVVLVEQGPAERSETIRMPLGLRSGLARPHTRYKSLSSARQVHLAGRAVDLHHGIGLGGSAAINAMIHTRGSPDIYDRWNMPGVNTDWSYQACLPFFRKYERAAHGASECRGRDGPLHLTQSANLESCERDFINCCGLVGLGENSDFNTYGLLGAGAFDVSIYKGVRQDTYETFLQAIMHSNLLTTFTGSVATRILLDGKRARGIALSRDNGDEIEIGCRRDVIVCAGALGSPQLLFNSGIGDGAALQLAGIDCNLHLPTVGKNLQDHVEFHIPVKTVRSKSLNFSMAAARWGWRLLRRGKMINAPVRVGAFLGGENAELGLIQYHFYRWLLRDDWAPDYGTPGFQISVGLVRPKSRGSLEFRKNDLVANPSYLSHDDDVAAMVRGIRVLRSVINRMVDVDKTAGIPFEPVGEQELVSHLRAKSTSSFHYSGTCVMGLAGSSVVDGTLMVHGVTGLRVVDASVFPVLPNTNTGASVCMVAEKACWHILNT
ncbi:GMC family oxidoreductase [Sphingomonas radiodurans]|uniref:GMC family oxidoreductase n=1 Tax=Sphingomonas radiodurans TaxID=2890321 RepID=UPI001E658E4F|nr:GMC family oxidoreductase N-terminal domain-containing protein [Sphingomonas radiodurans]WBH18302.1 GMC family oxidoreductase N-terminal domain-containing protein [Sphingomonas radiodurans]